MATITYPLAFAMLLIIAGAIVGMESLVRLVLDLIESGGWQAAIGVLIIVLGAVSLDRLLRALVDILAARSRSRRPKPRPTLATKATDVPLSDVHQHGSQRKEN